MNIIQNSFLFELLIADNTFVLVYFSGKNCSVCRAVKPKIEKLIEDNFPKVNMVEISVEQLPELAAQFSVFTVPVILFFIEGKEYIREVRIIDTAILNQKMEKIIKLYQ